MSAPAYTLAQLLTPQNLDTIRTRLLAGFQGAGFPAITVWQPKGGVEMGFVDMVGGSVADLLAADLPAIIAGGFLGKGSGLWLDVLAETVYLLERVPATTTSFNQELVVAATAQSYTWAVGDVEIVAPSGNRYRNTTAGTGEPGGFATLTFEAEAAGASYNDSPDAMALVTTFAGVTVRAAAPTFGAITQTGVSTGQILPSVTTPAHGGDGTVEAHAYAIRIDASGDTNTARFSMQLDGGAWTGRGVLFANQNMGGGLTLRAVNGSGTPSSFLAGDTFFFTAPGGSSYVAGSDEESDAALAERCRKRWPSLSLNPTDGLFQLWALLAVPTASRIQVAPDLATDPTAIPGRVRMWVADSVGPLDAIGLAKINAYVGPKLSILDGFLASGAAALPITATGNVLVTGPTLASVQQAAERGWLAYLGSIPIGGIVEISKLEQILMDAGAVDVATIELLRLNGDVVNVELAQGQVPTEAATLIASLEWTI